MRTCKIIHPPVPAVVQTISCWQKFPKTAFSTTWSVYPENRIAANIGQNSKSQTKMRLFCHFAQHKNSHLSLDLELKAKTANCQNHWLVKLRTRACFGLTNQLLAEIPKKQHLAHVPLIGFLSASCECHCFCLSSASNWYKLCMLRGCAVVIWMCCKSNPFLSCDCDCVYFQTGYIPISGG